MKEQLSKVEIQKLFAFVESKNVPYRDVQFEIVDHLASAMEEMKEENPEWPYDLCLQQVYKKFPITGFALLQMEKEEALNKYWKKKLRPFLLEYFKLPKIILTLALFFGFQQIFNTIEPIEFELWDEIIPPNMLIYFSITFIVSITSLLLRKRINTLKGVSHSIKSDSENFLYIRSFNTASQILTSSIELIPLYISCYIIPSYGAFVFHGVHSYLLAWFVIGLLIHWHLTLFVFPPLLRAEAETKYAHLDIKLA